MSPHHEYEQLGSFYLGKKYDLQQTRILDELMLYDSADLTTHAMCVGMTGSGKTGLCVSLLEEAAIDGLPAICIDPKGDLGNLLLTFPQLAADDFAPWIEPAEAKRQGVSLEEYAAQTASTWRRGLAEWQQDGERIERYVQSVERTIYTPASRAGVPLTVLRGFEAPGTGVREDIEALRESVAATASGLLTLVGIDEDPLTSREHILLSTILQQSWERGQGLDLPELIHAVQSPPFEKIGVFDVEAFFPAPQRLKLAMSLNNLLASPAFANWLDGEPLDIDRLLYTAQGKPRLSIISIAHLSDRERMFFVTIFLNELLNWTRSQVGTSSLRALFYMDEVFGYLPPVANPPSKPPMLLLLKQARAFGLGIVLATQNPADLDYRALGNIGTWFLGRLQTERDKLRVLEGLEGAALQSGGRFNRSAMEQTLAGLAKRVFLMQNAHDQEPTLFHSRWALSFLSGPLSRQQISDLTSKSVKPEASAAPDFAHPSDVQVTHQEMPEADVTRPPLKLPGGVEELFVTASHPVPIDHKTRYRPAFLVDARCHYIRVSANVDWWTEFTLLIPLESETGELEWSQLQQWSADEPALDSEAGDGFEFEPLAKGVDDRLLREWQRGVCDWLYRKRTIRVYHCKQLKRFSRPGEKERQARLSWAQELREERDRVKHELLEKYDRSRASMQDKIRKAHQRLEREQAEYEKHRWNTVLNFGQTIVGALTGNRITSRTATTGRSWAKAARQRTDVNHATDSIEAFEAEVAELEQRFLAERERLNERFRPDALELEAIDIACRKQEIELKRMAFAWLPWAVDAQHTAIPLWHAPD